MTIDLIQYVIIGFIIGLTAVGVGIGQGFAGESIQKAINRQPAIADELRRANILAIALTETTAILALIISLLLIFKKIKNYYGIISMLGIGFAIAIPGFIIGIVSALPAISAAISIARQPFISKKITNLMLLTQSLLQTPLIFGFIISLLIYNNLEKIDLLSDVYKFIAAGLCIGIGAIGPAIGVGNFTKTACESLGLNPDAYKQIFSFTLISQALTESPVIFATIISLWLITSKSNIPPVLFIATAIVMALGTLSTGINSGRVAKAACLQIAHNPSNYSNLSRASLLSQIFIDSMTIYSFIIAIFILLSKWA